MGDGFAIRKATPGDVAELAEMFDQYRVFYRKEANPRLARRFIGDRLRNRDSILFLAKTKDKDGGTLGFAQLYPSFSSASAGKILVLNDLYVRPAFRKRGVGHALISACLEYERAKRCIRVDLATEKQNRTAQSLYHALEFQENKAFKYYSKLIEA